jgi:hypothetical protein
MDVLLGILLATIAALYVAAPFFRRDTNETEPEAPPITPVERLEQQKREAYAAIKEAEFDHQMGKLSDADLQALTDKYRGQALAAIAALDADKHGAPGGPIRTPTRIAFCASCGQKLPSRANFCPACGRGLKADRDTLKGPEPAALNEAVARIG